MNFLDISGLSKHMSLVCSIIPVWAGLSVYTHVKAKINLHGGQTEKQTQLIE